MKYIALILIIISSISTKFFFKKIKSNKDNSTGESAFKHSFFLKKEEILEIIRIQIIDIEKATSKIDSFFESYSEQYMDIHALHTFKQPFQDLIKKNFKSRFYSDSENNYINKFIQNFNSLEDRRVKHNNSFIENEMIRCKSLFDNIEGKSMDDYQRRSVISDEQNMLINAGAGSGKTLTLLGQIAYLIEVKGIKPEEILVMMFNSKNAEEFNDRTEKVFGFGNIAKTFHGKGLDIIKNAQSGAKVDDKSLNDYVTKMFDQLEATPEKLNKYIELLTFYFDVYMEEYDEVINKKDVKENIAQKSPLKNVTLLGEITDSFEEKVIADYYYLNGVKYTISSPYDHAASTEGHRIYRPDFAFTEYSGTFHEHFGIDENGNVPAFFKGSSEKSAQEKYTEEMAWKRKIHEENGTKLYETYSYQYRNGTLFDDLKANLKAAGVKTTKDNYKVMWEKLIRKHDLRIRQFKELLLTGINQIKANEIDINDLRKRNTKTSNPVEKIRNHLILDLIEDIYNSYTEAMKKAERIDFNDMIIEANNIMKGASFTSDYKYIIVDKYQDISSSRFNFLKLLQSKSNAKIVAVGDDWQSIFRFTGSRVDYFTKYIKYNENANTMPITQTFRYDQTVADVAKRFITKNPAQMVKDVVSKTVSQHSGVFPVYISNSDDYHSILKQTILKLPVPPNGKKYEVMFLGRYKGDLESVKLLGGLIENGKSKRKVYRYPERDDILIYLSTIHASKGLEADFVVILNNKNEGLGFPSKITNDRFFDLFNFEDEAYPFAEERRLMYVALTRTKNACYLMVESINKSVFIEELEKQEGWEDPYAQDYKPCPKCKTGKLQIKNGKYGEFYGCSNFPLCNHRVSIKKEGRITV